MTQSTVLNLPDSVNRDLQDICEAWGKDREFVITSLIGRLKRGEWGPDTGVAGEMTTLEFASEGTLVTFVVPHGTAWGAGKYNIRALPPEKP